MHFDHVHLDEPKKSGEAVDPHAHALAALALFDAQLIHSVRDRGQRTLVIEDRAARMPHGDTAILDLGLDDRLDPGGFRFLDGNRQGRVPDDQRIEPFAHRAGNGLRVAAARLASI